MSRVLAFDYGTKRIGIAVTDPLQIIATALDTIESKTVYDFISLYCAKESVEAFVVGVSKNLDLSDNHATQNIEQFIKQLKGKYPNMPIYTIDERFTSSIAKDTLLRNGTKKMERRVKGHIDKISAVLILQSYLEQKQNHAI